VEGFVEIGLAGPLGTWCLLVNKVDRGGQSAWKHWGAGTTDLRINLPARTQDPLERAILLAQALLFRMSELIASLQREPIRMSVFQDRSATVNI
jgi:hypothetical protein